jgi:hypothetical protein
LTSGYPQQAFDDDESAVRFAGQGVVQFNEACVSPDAADTLVDQAKCQMAEVPIGPEQPILGLEAVDHAIGIVDCETIEPCEQARQAFALGRGKSLGRPARFFLPVVGSKFAAFLYTLVLV